MPSKIHALQKGKMAEDLALTFLQQQGLTLLRRNFRSRMGEIDLIMEDNETLVFIEVRYRSSHVFGGPLSSVNNHKQKKLIRTAQFYLFQHPSDQAMRFDVVGVTKKNQLEWIQHAFMLT